MNNIVKTISAQTIPATAQDLALINKYTRRTLDENEVYIFSVILCDNEIDRDYECFSLSALNTLKELFIGKTGIFDHNPKGENQTARIYDAEIITDKSQQTSLNENYVCLKAKAYMIKSEKNADLILDIDGGIKKEVSVSCSVASVKCSICGADTKSGCKHQKGKVYNKIKCHYILDEPTDAYEWSFVAVPAQKNAGVIKAYSGKNKDNERSFTLRDFASLIKDFKAASEDITISKSEAELLCSSIFALQRQAALGNEYKQDLIKEASRLSFLVNDSLDSEIFSSVAQKMDIAELKAFKSAYEKKLDSFDENVQLKSKTANPENSSNSDFKI